MEQYLGGRGCGKRHSIASSSSLGAGSSNSPLGQLPDSPRRRRTGLITVMETAPEISPALRQDVENRIRPRPISPLNFLLHNVIDAHVGGAGLLHQPSSPPPVSSPSKHLSLRQRRTGLCTVLETGKSVSSRSQSSSKVTFQCLNAVDKHSRKTIFSFMSFCCMKLTIRGYFVYFNLPDGLLKSCKTITFSLFITSEVKHSILQIGKNDFSYY